MRQSIISLGTILWVVAFLWMQGCATRVPDRSMLPYDSVKAVVTNDYPQEGKDIGELEAKIQQFRSQLQAAIFAAAVDLDVANKANRELKVADYYITVGWAAMVEGNPKLAKDALTEAQKGYDAAIDVVITGVQGAAI